MSNRAWHLNQGSLEAAVRRLYLIVSFGASGAVTTPNGLQQFTGSGLSGPGGYARAPSTGWKGVASITKTGTGAYTIALQDTYVRLLGAHLTWNEEGNPPPDGGTPPLAPDMFVAQDNSANLASPGVNVVLTSAGSPTNPAGGETALIELVLADSTAL